MGLRDVLLPNIKWELGDGRSCLIRGDPWCGEAMREIPRRSETVRVLVNEETGLWDCDRIIVELGNVACLQILSNIRPPSDDRGPDRLIYGLSSNGQYYVKACYNSLKGGPARMATQQQQYWDLIWNKGEVLPRVRLLMWKLSRGALPLSGIIASRIHSADPTCATCGAELEDVPHLLFNCPFSRGCWFASP